MCFIVTWYKFVFCIVSERQLTCWNFILCGIFWLVDFPIDFLLVIIHPFIKRNMICVNDALGVENLHPKETISGTYVYLCQCPIREFWFFLLFMSVHEWCTTKLCVVKVAQKLLEKSFIHCFVPPQLTHNTIVKISGMQYRFTPAGCRPFYRLQHDPYFVQ